MTIKVNGKSLNLNIGCRTFTSLSKLLGLLQVNPPPESVELNGIPVDRTNFASTSINSGDTLVYPKSSVTTVAPPVL